MKERRHHAFFAANWAVRIGLSLRAPLYSEYGSKHMGGFQTERAHCHRERLSLLGPLDANTISLSVAAQLS